MLSARVEALSERPGRPAVSPTLDTYSRTIPAMQEEAAALIAGLVLTAEQRRATPGLPF